MTTHAEFAAGLWTLANFVENNADTVGLPFCGTTSEFGIFADSRAELLAWMSVLTDTKVAIEDERNYGLKVHGHIGGVRVLVHAQADFLDYKVVGTVEKREYDLTGLTDEATS